MHLSICGLCWPRANVLLAFEQTSLLNFLKQWLITHHKRSNISFYGVYHYIEKHGDWHITSLSSLWLDWGTMVFCLQFATIILHKESMVGVLNNIFSVCVFHFTVPYGLLSACSWSTITYSGIFHAIIFLSLIICILGIRHEQLWPTHLIDTR